MRVRAWAVHADLPEQFENPGLPPHIHRHGDSDEKAAKRSELQVVTMFGLSMLFTILFIVSYFAIDEDATVTLPQKTLKHLFNMVHFAMAQQDIRYYLNGLLLVLDGITDPHNLGACLRSADAAGVHAVIVPKDRSAQLNATAKKVACGAAESVPLIRVTNLARTMRMLQEENIWIVGTAGEADHTLYQSKMTGRLALVMGAEGEGMRRLTREHCDELISIPMAGSVSSLNVSVATGICLFEAVRQRG